MATQSKELMPTENELVHRAAALGQRLAERRADAMAARRIPAQTIQDLVNSGLLRASLPARFGGYELPFGAHTSIAMELARHCPATGWVGGILGSHNWWLGKYHPATQEEVWAEGPDALVAAAFACSKGGTVAEKDGYRVDGEWLWCSGVDNCDWAIVVGPIKTDRGTDHGMALLDKTQFSVRDVWHSPGLKATGSNNVVVDNVFVPAHRVITVTEMNTKDSPGRILNGSATYRLPTLGVFAYSVAAPVIGMAKGTLDGFVDGMRQRMQFMSNTRIARAPTMQIRVSESSAEIHSAELIYRDDIATLRSAAEADRPLTALELARVQRNCGYIAKLCKQATHRLVEALGAGGLDSTNLVHTGYADVMAGSSHKALAFDTNLPPYGGALFGLTD